MSDSPASTKGAARRTLLARRECIIAAARTLFARNGFDRTGMAQIAAESRVLVGQIYRDFAGKEDLIAAIVERDVTELLDDPRLAGAVEGGQPEALSEWTHSFVPRRLTDDTRMIISDVLSEGTRNPRIAAIIIEAHERMRDRIAEAARLWLPQAERLSERRMLADLVLSLAGAIQHRQILGLPIDERLCEAMVRCADAEIARLRSSV